MMKYGRYQVVKEIGKGSMGVVYQAHDPNLDLMVALKVLRQDRLVSEAFVKRFLKEAKALGRLDRANIVRVYNVDEDSGAIYIAMEYIEGESLNEVMKRKRFSPEEIIKTGVTVAETLDYAHQRGIVHRDIKPSNILIRSDGWLKITDFGIAHIEDSFASEQTQDGEILGTPAYMSPEQVMSKPVDGRSDLFSLGIILYELCTGIRPFGGENFASIFKAITQDEPAQITSLNPSIPQDLARVIMKCLEKNPAERFESGKALSETLKGCLDKKVSEVEVSAQVKAKKIGFILSLVILLMIMMGGVAFYVATHKTKSTQMEEVRSSYLTIESTPLGAQVFIDNMFKGKTPLRIGLPIGKHEVRLTLPDYQNWEAQVQLNEGGETPLSVQLIPVEEKKT